MSPNKTSGLVLTGGGARGAYQAGVIRAVSEIAKDIGISNPFGVITGTSAGAINAAYLASRANNFNRASISLEKIWEGVSTSNVYLADPISIGRLGFRWLIELISGGLFTEKRARSLLDSGPLKEMLSQRISFKKIQDNIQNNYLHGLAITAMDYTTGSSRTFFQGNDIQPWKRIRRVGERTNIAVEHIIASASIPILFPPIRIGSHYFGDGSVRNFNPLSPAIKLGAKKLLIIAVRKQEVEYSDRIKKSPSLARILSILLNSVLLDAIDLDYETLRKVNQSLLEHPEKKSGDLHPIDVLMLRPSEDIGDVAAEFIHLMPLTIRHMLKGLGNVSDASDIVSYLLFESPFTKTLLEMGYQDTVNKRVEVEGYLSSLKK